MKYLMKAMIVVGVLLLAGLVGCAKTKEEKPEAEQSRSETNTTARQETTQKSKEVSNSVSTAKKKSPEPEKITPARSAGETIKEFYSAVTKEDYNKAKNCLSSGFLDFLQSHPISKSKGIEKTLDAIACKDTLDGITIVNETKHSISAAQARDLGLREFQDKGGEIYDIRYELTFKSPFDKLTPREIRSESLILEGDSYKIIRLPEKVLERTNVKGIQTFAGDNLTARFLEYKVVDVSESPSRREGWTSYVFTISIKNTSSEMLKIRLADLYAIVSEQQVCNAGSAFTPLPERVSITQRKYSRSSLEAPEGYLLPEYSVIYAREIQVPTLAPQVDFYLMTSDLRCMNVSAKGPFAPVDIFPPKSTNELIFGQTIVVKGYLEVMPLGLELIEESEREARVRRLLREESGPDKFMLWIKMKNLTLKDVPLSYETFYFQLFNEEGHTKNISGSLREATVPPLFEKIRCFRSWVDSDTWIDIERGRNHALLVGILDPNRKKEESGKLLTYGVYRFEGQPTISESEIKIEEIKAIWTNVIATITSPGGGKGFERIIIKLKTIGSLPVYIDEIKCECMGFERRTEIKKWIEPNSDATFEAVAGSIGANQTVSIEIISLNRRIITSFSGISPAPVYRGEDVVPIQGDKLPKAELQSSTKQELVSALEDLQSAIIKKINLEVDITAQCFTSVKEYRRAKLLADVFRPVLRVIQGTLSVVSKIRDAATLSGQVKTSLDNAEYVSEAASVFFMINGLRQAGEKLYYAIDDTAGYVNTVKEMLEAADQTTVIRMDPPAYKLVIKQYLDSQQGTPLIIAKTSKLTPDNKPTQGALMLIQIIRGEFRRIIDQIQKNELPQDFPLDDAVAEIQQLRKQIVESGVHNVDVRYSIYHRDGRVQQSRKLGAVAEHNKAFAAVAGALADNLKIEIYAEVAQLAATGADVAYIVTYNIPGSRETAKMTHQVTFLPQIVIEGKKMFTVDPEEEFYQMPQEMLFSLSIEFSNLWRIADDTVLSLTELLK